VTAFLLDDEGLKPYPAPEGFPIPCTEEGYRTLEDINKDTHSLDGDEHEPWDSYDSAPNEGDRKELLSMEPNDPYHALCIRSSGSLDLAAISSFNDFGEEKEEGNCAMSTVGSVGPHKPPPLKEKDELSTHSPSKSSGLYACLTTGRLWLSLYDDLAYFLDFSVAQGNG